MHAHAGQKRCTIHTCASPLSSHDSRQPSLHDASPHNHTKHPLQLAPSRKRTHAHAPQSTWRALLPPSHMHHTPLKNRAHCWGSLPCAHCAHCCVWLPAVRTVPMRITNPAPGTSICCTPGQHMSRTQTRTPPHPAPRGR